jgi:hypothetical protein
MQMAATTSASLPDAGTFSSFGWSLMVCFFFLFFLFFFLFFFLLVGARTVLGKTSVDASTSACPEEGNVCAAPLAPP